MTAYRPISAGQPRDRSAAVPYAKASAAASSDRKGTAGFYRNGMKRFLDVSLVLLSLPVVLPVTLLLALMVRLDGHGAFYSQARIGQGRRCYTIWKLRTMVVDADDRLETYLASDPAARNEWDATQKLKDDPRITRFGRFLRKTSLDELPQLWNVLIGDMSLVGPRPMMPEQMDLYPGDAYFALRPGITGPWQVSERNASTFADRAYYDTHYERSLSFMGDLQLLFATIRVVLRGTGY